MNIIRKLRSSIIFGLFILVSLPAMSQEKAQVKKQAETQLQTMTPQQIDARINEAGMTRQEAQRRASELGIDLNTYLQQKGEAQPKPGEQPPDAGQPTQPAEKKKVPGKEPEAQMEKETTPESKTEALAGKSAFVGPGGLIYFGYDIFLTTPASFAPSASGPADPDYLISTGDVLRISMWGRAELQSELEVDNEGRIFIPTVGPVLVSGLTLDRAIKTLVKQMSRSYSGLTSDPPTVNLDVTIARLRPKRVFIMGEVGKPGGYTVNSYATVFNTLFSVGGPTVRGSLRDIRVIRGNTMVARVDLYDYLTGAEKTNDLRVQNNDIIFVPVRGRTVSIKGEVRRPGIYELTPKENLRKVLDFAGNATVNAYLERVQVDRIVPFAERKKMELERRILDVNFRAIINEKKDYEVFDGDAFSVYSILDIRANVVSISGSVYRPGSYQFEKAPTLRDLVLKADSLLADAYLTRADIMRTHPDQKLEAIKVNLQKAMAGDTYDNIELRPLDQVKIYSIYDVADRRTVTIRGNIKNPGRYPYADSLSLYDLLFKAGGLFDSLRLKLTYTGRADLFRQNIDGLTKTAIPFNLGALLNGDKSFNPLLLPEDSIVVYEIDVVEVRDKTVEIFGSVRRPGRYLLTSGMRLIDVLIAAGGYTEDAYTLKAEISRPLPSASAKDSLVRYQIVRLPEKLDYSSSLTVVGGGAFHLEYRDQIFIRPDPSYIKPRLVTIVGEVQFPGQYSLLIREERLSSLIARAGGLTLSGYAAGGRLYRKNERINLDLSEALTSRNEEFDVVLDHGDSIVIPLRPFTIRVAGEVHNPGMQGFVEGDKLMSYIDRAGGLTDSSQYLLVTQPDGNTYKYGTGFFSKNPVIRDGSSIYATKLPPPPPAGKEVDIGGIIKDTFALIASAVTILVLARSL